MKTSIKRKQGFFSLNGSRTKIPTDVSMYDCKDCLASGTEHAIIEIAGPLSNGGQTSYVGEATTLHECTGCGAQTGPWVVAQI